MKRIVNFKLNTLATILVFIANASFAKEIELVFEAKTQYPISLHYTFLDGKIKYQGYFNSMQNEEIQYIYCK